MAVEQLPGQVREFAQYLKGLLSRLDQGGGWCGVFWQRDPEGMRACLDGTEVPPWDIVGAVLQDVAAEYGDRAAAQETERARALHGASLAAYDARPGGRDALSDRLDVTLREQRYAAERLSELGSSLRTAANQDEAELLRIDLAWARDDYDRATARCAELRSRMEELDRRALGGHARGALTIPPGDSGGDVFWVEEPQGDRSDGGSDRPSTGRVGRQRSAPENDDWPDDWPDVWRDASADRTDGQQTGQAAGGTAEPAAEQAAWQAAAAVFDATPRPTAAPEAESEPESASVPADSADEAAAPESAKAARVPKQRSKRRPRGSARFAGVTEEDAAALPAMPVPPGAERTLRGARFAGGDKEREGSKPRREALGDEARQVTVETVTTLVRLRREGHTGEAHAVLVEAAYWPAARFPLLAAELHRAGLGADWATLLWEAASLPADRMVAAADALVAAGRTADGQQMLRQGVARPASEISEAVLALADEGRHREVRALLDAYVRIRTPEDAARSVEADPPRLIPLLLEASRHVSQQRHWDLTHALRVAGYTA
ncbi:hypothetical protein [Streptomyces sp. NBC_00878]|uniref:hypothetical protein n=1 Tax=Streptomyces sp. NBC_00878 TaxID=2975854 RepID=UPI00224DAF0D|nr:hypothetical protein [Streptomyces sp. NBC_00878]MCX4904206.1 hypothetical protein [Streptomyces sp. NBC_00878]